YSSFTKDSVILIADHFNNRVVVYNSTTNRFENVLGQPTLFENGSGIQLNELNRPIHAIFHKNRVFVVDSNNHRILIYPSTQTYSFPEIRISRGNFNSQDGLSYPGQLTISHDKLFVTDGNSRVMIFEDIFGASRIHPSSSTNKAPIDIDIYGNDFPAGVIVRLVQGTYTINSNIISYSTYYIKARFDVTGKKSGRYNLEISSGTKKFIRNNIFELKNFHILEVIPNWQYRVGPVLLYIKGDGFIEGSSVKLTYPGEQDIYGTSVKISTNLITAVFDIKNKKVGLWSIVVSSKDETATLKDSFLVLHPYPANLLLEYIVSAIYEGNPIEIVFATRNVNGRISIPQDALKIQNINITISVAVNPPNLPKNYVSISNAFDFSPNGLEFEKDIDVEIKIGKIEKPELVRILVYNDSWQEIKPYYVDTSGTIKFKTKHFSIYLPTQVKPQNFDAINIYPNPWNPLKTELKIKNIPPDTKVRIYNISGEFINELDDADGDGIITWNAKNFSGNLVASGIYLLQLSSSQSEVIKK
ncbi:MAG: T9SS type A sorting domain-containing protein, partial [bacterium]|nr:T9SS type A sorting domain-containing protein [bacterium]